MTTRKLPALPALNKVLVPSLVGLLVVSAFLVGSLYTKVQYLEQNGVTVRGTSEPGTGQAQGPEPYQRVDAASLNIPQVTDQDRIRGARDAALTWIEYSDLECPFCKRIHPDLQKLLSEYDGKVRWVYRHFPLDSIHPKARGEAVAAECAAELGGNDGFWAYVDRLFEITPSNDGLDPAKLPQIAADIGLNKAKFQSCLDSGGGAERVQQDLSGGEKAGVTGTPGNFLLDDKGNAWVISGAVPYATMKQFVDAALAL